MHIESGFVPSRQFVTLNDKIYCCQRLAIKPSVLCGHKIRVKTSTEPFNEQKVYYSVQELANQIQYIFGLGVKLGISRVCHLVDQFRYHATQEVSFMESFLVFSELIFFREFQ